MARVIIVANRLPVTAQKQAGKIDVQPSPGGLATGLACLPEDIETLWIGWPGIAREDLSSGDQDDLSPHFSQPFGCNRVSHATS